MTMYRRVVGRMVLVGLAFGGLFFHNGTLQAYLLQTAQRAAGRDTQLESLQALRAASETPVRVSFKHGLPRTLAGRIPVTGVSAVERASTFLDRFRPLYGLTDPTLGLGVRRVGRPPNEDVVFFQTFRGVPVFGAEIVVSLDGNRVVSVVGVLPAAPKVDTVPAFSERQAEEAVRAVLNRPSLTTRGETRLMIFDRSLLEDVPRNPRLSWRVTTGGRDARQFFVDARTGQILFGYFLGEATGQPLHGYDLDMKDAEDESNASDTNCYWWSDDVDIADEDSFNSSYNGDIDAVKAIPHVKTAYAFFHENFNRHSFDDESSQLEVFLHATVKSASWSSDCQLIQFATGWVSRDIMVHEFSHGVIRDTSDLVYAFEPGALNESYADIMGVVADQEKSEENSDATDWLLGEDRTNGQGARRDVAFPSSPCSTCDLQPDTMAAFNSDIDLKEWIPGVMIHTDNGGVHFNSGIPNKTAFLMAAGGVHEKVSVPAMGRDKMRNLKWLAMTHLPALADFAMARDFELAAAETWAQNQSGGFTATDICSVRNAWAAVGLGAPDFDCDGTDDLADLDDDGDFIKDNIDNCAGLANPSQGNADGDYFGDACDSDDDGDGAPDASDNCSLVANDQADADHDGKGDACDDSDGDGALDSADNCVGEWNTYQSDTDGDGLGDSCDPDPDNDGVLDATPRTATGDNCPLTQNPSQADSDHDGIGNACDGCPSTPQNSNAAVPPWNDKDGDGIPDACDPWPNGDLQVVLVDGSAFALADALKPNGVSRAVELSGAPGASVSIPIRVCAQACPAWFDARYRVQLALTGLDPRVRVSVVTDAGVGVQKSNGRGESNQTLTFQPVGGQTYSLVFAFGPSFGHAERSVLQLRMSGGLVSLP